LAIGVGQLEHIRIGYGESPNAQSSQGHQIDAAHATQSGNGDSTVMEDLLFFGTD
jgi:hypothetical protein